MPDATEWRGHMATEDPSDEEATTDVELDPSDDLDDPELLLASAPLIQQRFATDWASLRAIVLQGTSPGSSAATAFYASNFNALHVHLSPPHASTPPALQGDVLDAQNLQHRVAAWQRDVHDWCLSRHQQDDEPSSSLPMTVPAGASQSIFPVMDMALRKILSGCCNMNSTDLNLKQAFFLVTFALGLQARWDHARAPSSPDPPRRALILLGGPGTGKHTA